MGRSLRSQAPAKSVSVRGVSVSVCVRPVPYVLACEGFSLHIDCIIYGMSVWGPTMTPRDGSSAQPNPLFLSAKAPPAERNDIGREETSWYWTNDVSCPSGHRSLYRAPITARKTPLFNTAGRSPDVVDASFIRDQPFPRVQGDGSFRRTNGARTTISGETSSIVARGRSLYHQWCGHKKSNNKEGWLHEDCRGPMQYTSWGEGRG